jgi:hypothetical protein
MHLQSQISIYPQVYRYFVNVTMCPSAFLCVVLHDISAGVVSGIILIAVLWLCNILSIIRFRDMC